MHETPSRNEPPPRASITLAGTLALLLLAVGGINWGLIALLELDVVAWLFGDRTLATRAVYLAVGVAAVYCLWKLPRWSRAG